MECIYGGMQENVWEANAPTHGGMGWGICWTHPFSRTTSSDCIYYGVHLSGGVELRKVGEVAQYRDRVCVVSSCNRHSQSNRQWGGYGHCFYTIDVFLFCFDAFLKDGSKLTPCSDAKTLTEDVESMTVTPRTNTLNLESTAIIPCIQNLNYMWFKLATQADYGRLKGRNRIQKSLFNFVACKFIVPKTGDYFQGDQLLCDRLCQL